MMESCKKSKRVVGLLLIFVFLLSCIGCQKNNKVTTNTYENNTEEKQTNNVEKKEDTYTYNAVMTDMPKTLNPHEYTLSSENSLINYTSMGLYECVMNESRDGYKFIPEMAADEPVDVTQEYKGDSTYGIPEDATTGYAFRIPLKENACWEDGTPITADSYVYSMKQMLDPKMKNFRVNTYTIGDCVLANAEKYYHSNQELYTPIFDGTSYRDIEDETMYFSFTASIPFFGDSAEAIYKQGYTDNFLSDENEDLYEKYSEKDYYPLTEEAKQDIIRISAKFGDKGENAYKEWCFSLDGFSESVDFDEVGIKATGKYELTLIFARPMSNFDLHYSLRIKWLVYEPYYEKYKKQTGDIIKTSYGTSVESYCSYGPYKMIKLQDDKEIQLVKNDKWYGYSDGKHDGEFQTTNINISIVESPETMEQLYLQGKLDHFGLTPDMAEKYRGNSKLCYRPKDFTFKLSFNSDYNALKSRETKGVNKRILSYQDFREAISFSIDRNELVAQCIPTNSAGYGLLNYNYVSNPETGEVYRNTEQAKQALCNVYDVVSEDEITGCDMDRARDKLMKAYQEALDKGDIKPTDQIELEFLVYEADAAYVKIANFVQNTLNEVSIGTPLQDRIKIVTTPDIDYYEHASEGKYEIILSALGGEAMNPYALMECYAVEDVSKEYGYKAKKEQVTITINGQQITKSFFDWYQALCSGEYATANNEDRVTILAGMEEAYLKSYVALPLFYSCAIALASDKIQDGSEFYVPGVEYGGIRMLTYLYTDKEWDEYCKEHNYQLLE